MSAIVPGGVAAFIVIFLVSAIERSLGVEAAEPIKFEDE